MSQLDKVLIVDYGSQFTQVLARKIREQKVYAEVIPDLTWEEVQKQQPKAIILAGGPSSVYDDGAPTIDLRILQSNIPMIGICYGQQLMCHLLGGKVTPGKVREYGRAKLVKTTDSPLFADIPTPDWQVWMSHGDSVETIPDDFITLASTDECPFAVIGHKTKPIYGLQFHPEVFHTEHGNQLIANMLFKIAKCQTNWDMGDYLQDAINDIRQEVGDSKVICAVSGGVDSTVAAVLLSKAISHNLHAIFIDTGLLRLHEAEYAQQVFKELGLNLTVINASELFLSRLEGCTDPERKRKIIGQSFIELFEQEANKHKDATFLAQGTLYSDVIESSAASKHSTVIKSHHNVGGLPEKMNLKLVEPLRKLFKDEVRELGLKLGIPEDIVQRHPFPGPGLAVRILGEITVSKLDLLRKADYIYIQELKTSGLYQQIWQAFAILTPIQTVGVMGDGRTYDYVLALRAVTSTDGMTADFFPLPYDFLAQVSNKIVNNVRGISRIVYDVTSKPPATIEWE